MPDIEQMLSIINEINRLKEMIELSKTSEYFRFSIETDDFHEDFKSDLNILQDKMADHLVNELSILQNDWKVKINELLEELKHI